MSIPNNCQNGAQTACACNTVIAKARNVLLTSLLICLSFVGSSQTQSINTSAGGFQNGTTFPLNGWTVVNPSTNNWIIGMPSGATSNIAYISNGGGLNSYNTTVWQNAHFYRDIAIPSAGSNINLSFKYKGSGEIDWDRLLVYLAPTSVIPVIGRPYKWESDIPGATLIFAQPAFHSGWSTVNLPVANSWAGSTVRLIFTWQNDDNTGTNPPVALDDISFSYCLPPTTVAANTTYSCIGGATGTITASASGGSAPYTYSLDGTNYQSSSLFSGLAAGNYTLYVKAGGGCINTRSVTVSAFPNSTGDQAAAGSDSWIAHVYDGTNFNNYIGTISEPEFFSESFGGDNTCLNVTSNAGTSSLITETFSVRMRMKSSRTGLFVVKLGSDDGSRLTVDGTMVYNNWTDQGYTDRNNVLFNLTGSSSLVYDFYENGGGNRVDFQGGVRLLENRLTTNVIQELCTSAPGLPISGDVFGTLPSGISLSGSGYQWCYSTTPGGAKFDIPGATGATFAPSPAAAPFNTPGTYYVYRKAKVSSTNNVSPNPYVATNESNAATIRVNAITLSATATLTCVGGSTGTITATATGGAAPLQYSIDGTNYVSSALFTGLSAGNYTIYVKSGGCIKSAAVTVNSFPVATDNQNAMGTNSWIGHVYDERTFQTYIGQVTQPETFDESFGGDLNCYTVLSNGVSRSIYTQDFAVKFRMNTTRKGLYTVTLGSDDGSRLSVDGTLIYNNWVDQSFNFRNNVLLNLSGSNALLYDFYENGGSNRVAFQNLTQLIENTLSSNTTQTLCSGETALPIGGDVFNALPAGITLSGTGYQWCYSTSPTGTRIDIAGATNAIFTPSLSTAPFNTPGTYYLYRKALLNSDNNVMPSTYAAVNESNAATIVIRALVSPPVVTATVNYCLNATATALSATGSNLNWEQSGSVGGSTVLSTSTYVDNSAGQNKKLFLTVATSNVKIKTVDIYVPAWQQVNNLVLGIFDNNGSVIATSNVIPLQSAGSTPLKITATFDFTIPTSGNYSIGVASGLGNIGSANPVFPLTETSGIITVTGVSHTGIACFNNIQFIKSGSTAPTPLTNVAGTTNYYVTQTLNGCTSAPATIAVKVNALPANPANPSSNSPQCVPPGVTLSRVGAVPAGQTFYWQTTALGTSTANSGATRSATVTGTQYLRARNNTTLCWSAGAGSVSVVINQTPAQASAISGSASTCAGSNETYSVLNTPGVSYTWSVPSGWTILSGQGSNSVSVTPGTSDGNISVIAYNLCGSAPVRTMSVAVNQTLYWAGKASVITGGTTSLDFNDPTNWSTSASAYVPAGISPTACNDVVIDVRLDASAVNCMITFSKPQTFMKNLTYSVYGTSTAANLYESALWVANQSVTVLGNTNLYAQNNTVDRITQLSIDVTEANSQFVYGGDLVTNATNPGGGAGECIVYPFSNPVGTINKGKIIVSGNAILSGVGDDAYPQLNKPTNLVFDGSGIQTITNNNSNGYPIYLGFNTIIGESNQPQVIFNGTSTEGFKTINNITIATGASLDIAAGQTFNRIVAGSPGLFTMESGSTLIIEGTSGGQTGSNFPAGFNTGYNLHAASTVNYAATAGETQHVYGPVDYGNLVMSTNGTGVASIKKPSADIKIAGNLDVQANTEFDLLSFSANRITTGGVLSVGSNAKLIISGSTGGSGSSNFPANFNSVIFHPTSTAIYDGANDQSIFSTTFGNLVLKTSQDKFAQGNITIAGDLTIQGSAIFDGKNFIHSLRGNWYNEASTMAYRRGSSTIRFNGTTPQLIGGNYGNAFYKISVENDLSVSPGLPVDVFGAVTYNGAGHHFTTNDQLTIKSTKENTAWVGDMTDNSISGKVTVERYISAHKAWRFLSIPTNTNQTIKSAWQESANANSDNPIPGYGLQITGAGGPPAGFDLATTLPSMKTFDPVSSNWLGIANTNSTTIKNNTGYMVFVRGDRTANAFNSPVTETVVRTKGELYTGLVGPFQAVPGKLASIGNPYASPVDFTKLITTPGIDTMFYVWDPFIKGYYNAGGFQTLSATNNWEPVPGGSLAYPKSVPCSTIQSGQAFLVHATKVHAFTPQNYEVYFQESSKVTGNGLVSFARPEGTTGVKAGRQFFKVSVFTGPLATDVVADGNVVAFDANFINEHDAHDALKITAAGENFDIKNNGNLYVIDARKTITGGDTIYYNMTKLARQNYQLRFTPVNMDGNGLTAHLVDKYLNKTTAISLADSSFYNFSINAEAASASPDRFKIVFRTATVLPVEIIKLTAAVYGEDVVLHWQVENETNMSRYEIERSEDGRLFTKIGEVPATNTGRGQYQFIDQEVLSGYRYYRIRSIGQDGRTTLSQVVRVKLENEAAGISVYPNRVKNGKIQIQMKNAAGGKYQLQLTNAAGQVVWKSEKDFPGGSGLLIFDISGKMARGIYHLLISGPSELQQIERIYF